MDNKVIGKISATDKSPTTSDTFQFWLADDEVVAPFDIVEAGNRRGSTSYGQITELFYTSDAKSHLGNYVASDFGDVEDVANTPRVGATYVEADVLTNDRDVYMPLRDGHPVRFPDEDGVRRALGLDRIREEDRLPAGFLTLSNGISLEVSYDRRFLIGPEGAHLNMSGISGLAAKTSYVMFLLQAIQQRCDDVAIIALNVKGQDLLHLHTLNPEATASDKQDWKRCGLEMAAFSNVRYYYPYREVAPTYANTACDADTVTEQLQAETANNYIYTFDDDKSKLDLLFSNIDDPSFTIDSIIHEIETGGDFRDVDSWQALLEKVADKTHKGGSGKDQSIQVQSWRRFHRLLRLHLRDSSGIYQDALSAYKEKHHARLEDALSNIEAGQIHVIDVANLEEQEQCLVFGDIIRTVYQVKLGMTETRGEIPRRIVIFVDELNKYAPSNLKSSPILSNLLEITERGRSLGIILFAAQQFKSAVHDRVKGNCGTHVYGRTNSIEISKSDYKSIPSAYANMMTRLSQGNLVLQHPPFPRLLKVSFPRPSYYQPK